MRDCGDSFGCRGGGSGCGAEAGSREDCGSEVRCRHMFVSSRAF